MSLKKALSMAKRTNEETVGFSFKMPISLKNEFEALCKKNSVTMTSMILASVYNMVDESIDNNTYESIDDLTDKIIRMNQLIEAGIDGSDLGFDPRDVLKAAKAKLRSI